MDCWMLPKATSRPAPCQDAGSTPLFLRKFKPYAYRQPPRASLVLKLGSFTRFPLVALACGGRYGTDSSRCSRFRFSWAAALVRFAGRGCPIFAPASQAQRRKGRFSLRRTATRAAPATSAPRTRDFLLRDAGGFLPDHAGYIPHRRPSRSVRLCGVAWCRRSACADGGISFAGWKHLFHKEDAVFDWRCVTGCSYGHGPAVPERSLTRPTGG